jgi:hypothetical protein
MFILTNYVAGHCVSSTKEGVASLGTWAYSGSSLAIECSEGVSTSSSFDVTDASFNLNTAGRKFSTFVLSRKRYINYVHCCGFLSTNSIFSCTDVSLCPNAISGFY